MILLSVQLLLYLSSFTPPNFCTCIVYSFFKNILFLFFLNYFEIINWSTTHHPFIFLVHKPNKLHHLGFKIPLKIRKIMQPQIIIKILIITTTTKSKILAKNQIFKIIIITITVQLLKQQSNPNKQPEISLKISSSNYNYTTTTFLLDVVVLLVPKPSFLLLFFAFTNCNIVQ